MPSTASLTPETTEKKFKMPKKFNPKAFFEDFYGIIAHEHAEVETI